MKQVKEREEGRERDIEKEKEKVIGIFVERAERGSEIKVARQRERDRERETQRHREIRSHSREQYEFSLTAVSFMSTLQHSTLLNAPIYFSNITGCTKFTIINLVVRAMVYQTVYHGS